MDIRSIGTPTTTSQGRRYRETPDSSFYQAYQVAFAAQKSSDPGAAGTPASLEEILGTTHAELSALRGVSRESQATYAAVLNKAYSSGGIGNARQFLGTLSAEELEAVRQNHCLANPIDPRALSEEGAENLLLPEGYSVDLDQDGIDEVGTARTISFPPKDAPAAFKEAWLQSTSGMDEGMAMSYGLLMHSAVYGLQVNGRSQGSVYAPDSIDSYRSIVSNYLSSLEEHRGLLPAGQYERDKEFFGKLQALLSA